VLINNTYKSDGRST